MVLSSQIATLARNSEAQRFCNPCGGGRPQILPKITFDGNVEEMVEGVASKLYGNGASDASRNCYGELGLNEGRTPPAARLRGFAALEKLQCPAKTVAFISS